MYAKQLKNVLAFHRYTKSDHIIILSESTASQPIQRTHYLPLTGATGFVYHAPPPGDPKVYSAFLMFYYVI